MSICAFEHLCTNALSIQASENYHFQTLKYTLPLSKNYHKTTINYPFATTNSNTVPTSHSFLHSLTHYYHSPLSLLGGLVHLAKGGIWRVAKSVSASSARSNGADDRLALATSRAFGDTELKFPIQRRYCTPLYICNTPYAIHRYVQYPGYCNVAIIPVLICGHMVFACSSYCNTGIAIPTPCRVGSMLLIWPYHTVLQYCPCNIIHGILVIVLVLECILLWHVAILNVQARRFHARCPRHTAREG